MTPKEKALLRLSFMSDWQELQPFHCGELQKEIKQFDNDWKPYNPTKPNNRWGLSVTSIDGELTGIPDLTSLSDFERKTGIHVDNIDINVPTPVYYASETLRSILEPFKPWLTRCHFLKLNTGGFFPEHFDITQSYDYEHDEIRLVGFVNTDQYNLKWIYDDKVITKRDGSLWYFNASKRHTVFSTRDNVILLVVCLGHWDESLFDVLLNQFKIK